MRELTQLGHENYQSARYFFKIGPRHLDIISDQVLTTIRNVFAKRVA